MCMKWKSLRYRGSWDSTSGNWNGNVDGNENKMEMGMHVMGMGSALSQLLLFPIVILSM